MRDADARFPRRRSRRDAAWARKTRLSCAAAGVIMHGRDGRALTYRIQFCRAIRFLLGTDSPPQN
jgi:hypothetical protein